MRQSFAGMRTGLVAVLLVCVGGFAGVRTSAAQAVGAQGAMAACGVAPVGAASTEPNIFNEQQEGWLGDVEADQAEAGIRTVRDPALSAHLQAIADRLVAALPPTGFHFRVILVDSDAVNAFSLAGGHIYIMRKLASVAANDDELAGVIGHEIGHIVSHQFAFDTTRELKRLMNVTSVSDEADIRAKFAAMLDAEMLDKHPNLGGTDHDEAVADAISIYAVAAAGYRPQAFTEFWNRVFFVQGKTGNRLGDLLGITKPDQKRLRGMEKAIAALPPDCGKGASPDKEEFFAWHRAVMANREGEAAVRSASMSEVTLKPPLRMELQQVRFSPDGKSILAQDESSIFVLSRDPFAVRYRIDADNAMPANFSPDSQSITFSTPGLRTEQWSAKENKQLAVHELLARNDCFDNRLSPDGRTMMCVEIDEYNGYLGLALLDTATSDVVWEKKVWERPSFGLLFLLYEGKYTESTTPLLWSSYSADNNTVLMGHGADKIAIDLRDRSVIKTGGGLQGAITGDYAFIGNDTVAGMFFRDPKDSGLYSFPQGKLVKKVAMPFNGVKMVTNSGSNLHVLGFGLKDYDVGLGDLGTGKFLAAMKTHSLDEYDGQLLGESGAGGVSMLPIGDYDPKASKVADLPISPLGRLHAVAMSPDGKFLALSTRYRGGLWSLTTGKQLMLIHGFTDASWTKDDTLYLDVAKQQGSDRHIAQVSMTARALNDMPYKVDDESHMRYGRLTDWKLDDKKKTWNLEMRDPVTSNVAWSKSFPDKYFNYTASYGNRDLLFSFPLKTHTAKDALKANSKLAEEAQGVKDKDSARLIEVINGETGAEDGEVVAELPPNYAGVDGLNRAGDLLYVQGLDDRTAVYSISTGQKMRQLFGYVRALDPQTGRVFTTNRRGEAVVYDAAGLELAHYQLGDAIRYALFRDSASVVSVLTADQTVRVLSVGEGGGKEKAGGAAAGAAPK